MRNCPYHDKIHMNPVTNTLHQKVHFESIVDKPLGVYGMAVCGVCKNNAKTSVGYTRNTRGKRLPKNKKPQKHKTTIPLNRPNPNSSRPTGLYLPQIDVRPGIRR